MEEKDTAKKTNSGKGKKVLIVILIILYTAIVSLVSSVVTKEIVEYKQNKIFQEQIEAEKKRIEEMTTGSNKVNVHFNNDSEETTVAESE